MSDDGILHFNPWMDFNDGPPSENPFGCDPDPEQIAVFLDTVFSWCEGLIPLRGFVDKGQGRDGKPHNIWIPADDTAPEKPAPDLDSVPAMSSSGAAATPEPSVPVNSVPVVLNVAAPPAKSTSRRESASECSILPVPST